ncbi:MAG: branched-chain amino acid ABC transporter permease [Clostridiales Family XIII bacterium]|jgi:branched-chain amino acid transport system permease protein|nr:branched-chain amino acid ABC transporter permease [Clostridiales Family XIII bacterium]
MEQIAQVLVSGLLSGGVYALASVGLALIFGVVGLVNFAHGEYLMLAMYIAWLAYDLTGASPYASMPLNLALMAVAGYLTFRIIMARVINADHSIQMLITLALSMALQNLALMLWKADYRTVRIEMTNQVIDAGFLVISAPRAIAFAVAALASLLLYLFLQRTWAGTAMRAVAQDGRAAVLMGISLRRVYGQAFVIGTVLVGLAGLLLSPIYPVFPLVGAGFSTLAFIVVVLGGLSSVPGAIAGGLLVGVVESLAGYFAGPAYQQAAYFLLFIVVLIFRPEGIAGGRGGERRR